MVQGGIQYGNRHIQAPEELTTTVADWSAEVRNSSGETGEIPGRWAGMSGRDNQEERWSKMILAPMRIRTAPPNLSTQAPPISPIFLPITVPTYESTIQTTPMMMLGTRILSPSTPRLNPTATASRLVATDRMMRVSPRDGSFRSASSCACLN